jgi:hypothetical protein
MLMALGRCSGLFSEGVTSWDETGQCCHWRIIPFSLLRTLVHAGFCMFPQSCDLRTETVHRIFIVRAWCSECVHTLDLGLSSHLKDVRVTEPTPSNLGVSYEPMHAYHILWVFYLVHVLQIILIYLLTQVSQLDFYECNNTDSHGILELINTTMGYLLVLFTPHPVPQ